MSTPKNGPLGLSTTLYDCAECGAKYPDHGEEYPNLCPSCTPYQPEITPDETCNKCGQLLMAGEGQTCNDCTPPSETEKPGLTAIKELGLEMYDMGTQHGSSRVIAYLRGRLGADNALVAELSIRFLGVQDAH